MRPAERNSRNTEHIDREAEVGFESPEDRARATRTHASHPEIHLDPFPVGRSGLAIRGPGRFRIDFHALCRCVPRDLPDPLQRRDTLPCGGFQPLAQSLGVVGHQFRPVSDPTNLHVKRLLVRGMRVVALHRGDDRAHRPALERMRGRGPATVGIGYCYSYNVKLWDKRIEEYGATETRCLRNQKHRVAESRRLCRVQRSLCRLAETIGRERDFIVEADCGLNFCSPSVWLSSFRPFPPP